MFERNGQKLGSIEGPADTAAKKETAKAEAKATTSTTTTTKAPEKKA